MTGESCGGIMLTPANTDDRTRVPKLLQQLFGKVFADKGYVSQKLAKHLLKTAGIQLITKLKRNMKQRLLPPTESRNNMAHPLMDGLLLGWDVCVVSGCAMLLWNVVTLGQILQS